MEHDPIEIMLNEHELIAQVEDVIENLNNSWIDDSEKYEKAITLLIDFFRDYADGHHHRKEEEVLFPAICDHPDFILQDIIDELEQHHEDFREYTKEIVVALEEKDYKRSYDVLTNYLQDLLDHIAVENDELFVLAETLLEEDELETIYFKFKDIDMEIGDKRKTELEQSIQIIKNLIH